jgi:hypothetical protein
MTPGTDASGRFVVVEPHEQPAVAIHKSVKTRRTLRTTTLMTNPDLERRNLRPDHLLTSIPLRGGRFRPY